MPVIKGFRIDVTSDELSRFLDARVLHHVECAAACDRSLQRLEGRDSPDDDEGGPCPVAGPWCLEELQQRRATHKARAETLRFASDHIVSGEIYRLSDADLRTLGVWPEWPDNTTEPETEP